MTLEEFLADEDWKCVFGEEGNDSHGNCDADVESADGTPAGPRPLRRDVAQILAHVCVKPYSYEDSTDWYGTFRLHDGRLLYAQGGCDNSGWS